MAKVQSTTLAAGGNDDQKMHYDDWMGSSPYTPVPEILPPGVENAPPPPERRRPRSSWASSPATYLLVGINCAVFLAMVASHISPVSPTPEQLFNWGADNAGAVLIHGQWWRIITAMFVHVGIIHLATNMWCLWNLGLLAEPLMGSVGVLAVYLLTGAAGNLLSNLFNWWSYYPDLVKYRDLAVFPSGAGASGAVFGIAGALILLLKSRRLPVPPEELRKLRKSVIYFAAINLAIGFSVNFGSHLTGLSIDNMAHLGGFSCGLLFATPMVPKIGSSRPVFQARLGAAVAMVAVILVLFGFYLSNLAG
jgi:rhomboid protease GluP